jgi:hypothetical protein
MTLGAAQLASGALEPARAAFARSQHLLDDLALPHLGIEAAAWLARTALQEGDLQVALGHTEEVLAHLSRHGHLDGTEKPLLIRWTCHEVLAALADARAPAALADAWQALKAQLDALPDNDAQQRLLGAQTYHLALKQAAQRAGLN